MVRLLVIPFLAALSAPVMASPIAEVICDSTAKLHDRLQYQYDNQRTALGVRSPEQVMEVWTGPRGDWTLVMTYASGRSCIVAMGENWQQLNQDPA